MTQTLKNYRHFQKYTSFWEIDSEINQDPFPHILIKLHGRLESYMALRTDFLKKVNGVVRDGSILVFDFTEVPYASSVFFKYFLDWCNSRHDQNSTICVTRISAFMKGVLQHLDFHQHVYELPYDRREWRQILAKENPKDLIAKFKRFLAHIFS